jgi:hypothetical protein
VEPDYNNGRRALFQGRGGGFAAIAAILPWSSTLIHWNDNAGLAKAVNTPNIWGSVRDFFNSGAFGAMLLWGFFILILPTIMGLHEHNDAFAIMEDKAERFCDCCRSPLACIFGTLTAILLIRSFPSFNLRVVGLWVIWLNNRNNLPMFLLLRQVLVLGRITGFLVGSPLHSFG